MVTLNKHEPPPSFHQRGDPTLPLNTAQQGFGNQDLSLALYQASGYPEKGAPPPPAHTQELTDQLQRRDVKIGILYYSTQVCSLDRECHGQSEGGSSVLSRVMGKGLRKMFELGLTLKRVNDGGWCRQREAGGSIPGPGNFMSKGTQLR